MPVFRIEVHPKDLSNDPAGAAILAEIQQLQRATHTTGANGQDPAITSVHTARVYLLAGDEAVLTPANLARLSEHLFADPVTETPVIGIGTNTPDTSVEVHLKPGVMDPVAASAEMAIADMLGLPRTNAGESPPVRVLTGRRYTLMPPPGEKMLRQTAQRVLANDSIEQIHLEPFFPAEFPSARPYQFAKLVVPVQGLTDQELLSLSRRGHLFLDLAEMQAIRDYFVALDRQPTDVEMETIAQSWSEHCVHKTLKSRVEFTHHPVPDAAHSGHDHHTGGAEKIIFDNLVKSTIFRATSELNRPWTLSVFKDNAGVIAFDEDFALCMKVETHNRPSAIEPYGGAATGIGGCIRDVIGTGLGAKPIACTDIFCFADPATPPQEVPHGVIHPRRTAQRVVAGVRDYGNRMGIPTVNGAVFFDQRYIGNPLVFCGTLGLMPREFSAKGAAQPGDHIIVIGGRTGRDGIHGATFSSDVLTNTHADEFSHAVQIGNAITEKKMLDVILQARDHADGPLFGAITDCGAGGLSSAVGEMGQHTGAAVHLERVPLKYQGLSYTEIWISEAQERMVLAVPPQHVAALLALAAAEDVQATDIGEFDGSGKLSLYYNGTSVGQLDMSFIHDGLPAPVRKACWQQPLLHDPALAPPRDYVQAMVGLFSHPTIASKHWIIRQYDHEVQGATVIKPLTGPRGDGPGDAAVLQPLPESPRAVALAVGCQIRFGEIDPYQMALNSMDEAIRNIVCVGGDPRHTAILDNFCWPKCTDPMHLGALVRACQACYDGAKAFGTPFISGKDSLSNEFITDRGERICIPYTLLISAVSVLPFVDRAMTMDAKEPGNLLVLVGRTRRELGGSMYWHIHGHTGACVPQVDLTVAPALHQAVAELISHGLVCSAHDLSEGGLAVAMAEMLFAGGLGAQVDLAGVPRDDALGDDAILFSESATRYLLEIKPEHLDAVVKGLRPHPFGVLGTLTELPRLKIRSTAGPALLDEPVDTFKQAWLKPLDW